MSRFEKAKTIRSPSPSSSLPGRIFVTGASGYIGVNLLRHLLAVPGVGEVRGGVRDRASASELEGLLGHPPEFRAETGEIPQSPWDLNGVDAVVHLAAARTSRSPASDADFFVRVNTEGTRRLLRAADEAGVSRFVFLSSQAVYGTKRKPLWPESLSPRPETPYARSKVDGEELCHRESPCPTVVLRAARVYGLGFRIRWSELPHLFASRAALGEPLIVHGGGRNRVDLVHLDDLCRAIVRGLRTPLPEAPSGPDARKEAAVFNVGSGRPVSIMDLARTCRSAVAKLGWNPPFLLREDVAREDERNFGMDIGRAEARLGWEPRVSLENGIGDLLQAAREAGR